MQDIVGRNPLGQEVVPPQQDMLTGIEPRMDQATLQEKIKTHPPTIQFVFKKVLTKTIFAIILISMDKFSNTYSNRGTLVQIQHAT